MKRLNYLLFFLVALTAPAYATTWTAASCSYTDVNFYAGNGGGSGSVVDGDIVIIPSCAATTWTSRLTITKAITLEGAGIGNTTIRNGVNPDGRMISWTLVASKDARLSGMTINDNGAAQAQFGVLELIGATGARIRVDHIKFDHPNGFNIMTYSLRGVFDHNEFVWSTSGSIPIYVFDPGTSTYGDESWNSAVNWGSSDFLFVENNIFTYESSTGFCSDGFRGTRVVYRYNTVAACSFQNHGTESSGRNRGGRAMEVYRNTFTGSSDTFMALRSGSGISWGNNGPAGRSAANADLDRAIAFFTWNGAANGRSRLDINDAGNPFYTGTAACGAGCSSLTVTVSPDPGWSTSGNGQWYGYIVRKTSTCGSLQCHAVIVGNTSNTLTFSSSGGFAANLSFTTGETFEINKITEAIDQPGRGGGQLFATAALWSGNSSCAAGVATINTTGAHGLAGGDYVSLYVYSGDNALHGVWLINTIVDSDTFTVNVGCTTTAQGEWFKFPAAWNDQVDFPIYQFLNTTNGANATLSVHTSAIPSVRVNEHYYDYDPTATTSATNETVGVRSGTIANRPNSCTTGVAYWATNEGEWDSTNGATADGKMYICTATNTWSDRYGTGTGNSTGLPYTYPHPLAGNSPTISSIDPASGVQGASNLNISVMGTDTSWANGTTVATFSGTGITVNSTTCASTTACTATINIAGNATAGPRTLTMTTNSEVETTTFTVNPPNAGTGGRALGRSRIRTR